jgi:hypothetical protein
MNIFKLIQSVFETRILFKRVFSFLILFTAFNIAFYYVTPGNPTFLPLKQNFIFFSLLLTVFAQWLFHKDISTGEAKQVVAVGAILMGGFCFVAELKTEMIVEHYIIDWGFVAIGNLFVMLALLMNKIFHKTQSAT